MGKFSRDVSKFVKKSKEATLDVPKKVAIDLFSAIVRDTPVLSGRARANWQVGIDAAPENDTTEEDKSGGAAINKIVDTVKSNRDPESVYVLRNNLPYIHPLEYDGISQKAPQGMVRRNVARFKPLAEKIAKEIN